MCSDGIDKGKTTENQQQSGTESHRDLQIQPNDVGGNYRVWVTYQQGHDQIYSTFQHRSGVRIVHDLQQTDAIVMTVDAAGLADLQAEAADPNSYVDTVELDLKRSPQIMPRNESKRGAKKNLRRLQSQVTPYGVTQVQADQVWPRTTGLGTKVCVVDTGMDNTHPDFDHGRFTGFSEYSSLPWSNDENGHGTHVTGTIAALDNSIGVLGVSPDVDIVVVRVFNESGQWVWSSDVVDAAIRCQTMGAKIVSMSLGGPGRSNNEERAFSRLLSENVISVAAAGNDGNSELSYPASYPDVISVAAIDSNKNHASFSQTNSQVDISAAGVNVYSTIPGRSYDYFSGTSMATPHISAVIALLWTAHSSASATEIINALYRTAENLGDSRKFGNGLAQAYDALLFLDNGETPDTPPGPGPAPGPGPSPPCAETPVEITIQTDRWGYETSIMLARDDGQLELQVNEGELANNDVKVYPLCLSLSRCWTFTIEDSEEDGLWYGAYYAIKIDGSEVRRESDFDAIDTYEFGNCAANAPPPPPPTTCASGESEVNFIVQADFWGHETSISVTRDDDTVDYLINEGDLGRHEFKSIPKCLDLTRCWTFTIKDKLSDGLFNGGFYAIEVNGVREFEGSDFGESASHDFGTCGGGGDGDGGGGTCEDVEFIIQTDDWAYETAVTVTREDGHTRLDESSFASNSYNTFTRCLALNNHCWTFTIVDTESDGLWNGGYYAIKRQGTEIKRGDSFGLMDSFKFGNCGGARSGCTNANFIVQTDNWGSETAVTVTRSDGVVTLDKPIGSFASNSLHSFPGCLDLGTFCYTFTITDDAEDGLWYGAYYAIEIGGVEVKRGDFFGTSDTLQLGTCSSA